MRICGALSAELQPFDSICSRDPAFPAIVVHARRISADSTKEVPVLCFIAAMLQIETTGPILLTPKSINTFEARRYRGVVKRLAFLR